MHADKSFILDQDSKNSQNFKIKHGFWRQNEILEKSDAKIRSN